jgi:hypothetical protein
MTRPPPSSAKHTGVMDAIEQSDTLASMLAMHQKSTLYLKLVESVLPPGFSQQVKAGPIEDGVWCLLVTHNAAAAKLRQLLPSLSAHLRSKGHHVQTIRIKVMSR